MQYKTTPSTPNTRLLFNIYGCAFHTYPHRPLTFDNIPSSNLIISAFAPALETLRPKNPRVYMKTFFVKQSPLLIRALLSYRPQAQRLLQPPRLRLFMNNHGDINNVHAARATNRAAIDPSYSHVSLAIPAHEDDAHVRQLYRPFLLHSQFISNDWVAQLELSTALKMVQTEILDRKLDRLRILVLYGSLRSRYVHE